MSRYLGQHFLKNNVAITKIIAELDIHTGDTVIEIGPGTGVFTIPLLQSSAEKIIAIEKDSKLAYTLRTRINDPRFILQESDVLKLLPPLADSLKAGGYKLVGNIPYYLTGYLFRTIGKLTNKPSDIVFTVQKEVALRICAKPPHMNKLAASIQYWAKPEIIMRLKPRDFNPPPKVDSAIIKLAVSEKSLSNTELQNYYKTVQILFKQPRKTLLNNLLEGSAQPKKLTLETLEKVGLTGAERPGNVTIEIIQKLSQLLFP